MKRDDRELVDPSGPQKARAQKKRVHEFSSVLREDIHNGIFTEEQARGMKRAFNARLNEAAKLERPIYVVRYGLVADHQGRDWGVGRPANRCLECHLDNAWLYVNRKGVTVRLPPGLKVLLNEEPAEFELVQDLFRDVPRPIREKHAELFLELLLKGTTTKLAVGLRDQVVENQKKHSDHFTDEDFPPRRSDFGWSLLDSLQSKIHTLKKRIKA